ncbi:MAG: hypothetical protein WA177_06985, partial [Xanthobacteraceae bacterium]
AAGLAVAVLSDWPLLCASALKRLRSVMRASVACWTWFGSIVVSARGGGVASTAGKIDGASPPGEQPDMVNAAGAAIAKTATIRIVTDRRRCTLLSKRSGKAPRFSSMRAKNPPHPPLRDFENLQIFNNLD